MAAATLVHGSYGTRAHTGTDETVVRTGRVALRSIICRGTGGGETVTIKDSAGTVLAIQVTTVANHNYELALYGAVIEGPTVTLSAGTASALFLVA